MTKELDARNKLELEAANFAGALRPPPQRTGAERRKLRRIAKGLRKEFTLHVPTVPPIVPDIGGIFAYTLNLAPTYAFGSVDSDFAGPGNSASARRSSGEMQLRFSDQSGDNLLHFKLVELGGFFFPSAGESRITAAVNPTVAFSWYMDSEGPRVYSDGFLVLKIIGFKGSKQHGESRSAIELWRKNMDDGGEGFQFDFRTATAMPMSTSLALNGSDFYLVTLKCIAAFGTGGPANLESFAIGSISASLPSIALSVKVEPVIATA